MHGHSDGRAERVLVGHSAFLCQGAQRYVSGHEARAGWCNQAASGALSEYGVTLRLQNFWLPEKRRAWLPSASGNCAGSAIPYRRCVSLKSVCWLTDIDPVETEPDSVRLQLSHQALLHLKATLTAVDRFFMRVGEASRWQNARWPAPTPTDVSGSEGAYNPEVLVKVLGIFGRTSTTARLAGTGKTPAMRLGLARGYIAPEDILYFTPEPPERRRAPAARSLKPSGPVAHASESHLPRRARSSR